MLDFSFSNILHSNVINFAIMIAFFAFLACKLNVMQKIEEMRASIQKKVEDSDAMKEEAKRDFQNIKDSLGNIEEELDSILKKAENTAKSFEQKAKDDIDKAVALIKQNAQKQLETEQSRVKRELLKNVSASSVEIAQKQIKTALDNDKQLHRKYIEDFINSIDKLDV